MIKPKYGNFINGKFVKDWRIKKGKRYLNMGGCSKKVKNA